MIARDDASLPWRRADAGREFRNDWQKNVLALAKSQSALETRFADRVVVTDMPNGLAAVGPVTTEAQARGQALVEEFHGLGILPTALTFTAIVGQPNAA